MLEKQKLLIRKDIELLREKTLENKNKILTLLVLGLLLISAMAYFRVLIPTIILIAFFAVAVIPNIYKRWVRVNIGVEFMVFATVMVGKDYGAMTGFAFGALTLLVSDVMVRSIGEWSLLNAAAIGTSGIIADVLRSHNIVLAGMAAVLATETIRQFFPIVIGTPREKINSITATLIHLMLNLWLFSKIAPLLS